MAWTKNNGVKGDKGDPGDGNVNSVNGHQGPIITLTASDLGAESIDNKGVANGYAGLDGNSKVPLSQLPDVSKQQTYVVLDTNTRNALTNLLSGDKAYETSTGDSYIWDGTQWLLLADADWANVSLDWTNIINKPNLHSHTNKEVLDKLEEVSGELQYNGESIGGKVENLTNDDLTLGGRFRIQYNSLTDSLDIVVVP